MKEKKARKKKLITHKTNSPRLGRSERERIIKIIIKKEKNQQRKKTNYLFGKERVRENSW
jgi:hypothetical protein